MLKPKILVYIILGIMIISYVYGATVHGTLYDFSLKKVNNARVEIDTSPKQFMVAQNGTYSFNVPNGRYTIKAQILQKNIAIGSAQENITITQDGYYVLDLILFPDIEEGIEDFNIEIGEDIADKKNNDKIWLIGFIVLFIAIIILGVYYYIRTRKREDLEIKAETTSDSEDDELEQLLKIIKQEGGRATQKEIRKQIPLSEAKISLMIAELEHKGIIEKIKKGRGNIIILKKR